MDTFKIGSDFAITVPPTFLLIHVECLTDTRPLEIKSNSARVRNFYLGYLQGGKIFKIGSSLNHDSSQRKVCASRRRLQGEEIEFT